MANVIHHTQYVALFHDNQIWRVLFVGNYGAKRSDVFNDAEKIIDRIYSQKSDNDREIMKNRLLVVRAKEAIERFPDLFREREESMNKENYGRGQESHNTEKKGGRPRGKK